MRVQRFDRGTLAPAKRLDNGWLRVEGRTARTGLLEYVNADGSSRHELVLPEELFSAASLDSACMVPVVNTHPIGGLLDAATAKVHQVGSVGEKLRADGDFLVAPLMITDGKTVSDVESGKQELSWGYDCAIDPPDPSLFGKWGKHDGIQRGRHYNHLAIVDRARAGEDARIRIDAAGNAKLEFAPPLDPSYVAMQQRNAATQQPENKPMATMLRIDGHQYSAEDPAIQSVIDRVLTQVRADGEKAIKAEKERADALAASLGHVKANAIARGSAVRSLTDAIDAMKAKMIGCDECSGTGKVDAEGSEANCSYCDGKGSFRFHDAVKGMAVGEEKADDVLPALVDDKNIETESPKAVELAVKVDAKKADEDRRAAKKRHADSLDRMIARAAKVRTALTVEALGHLGADAKLDGKSNAEIKREVVAKLAPHVKLDALKESEIALLYATETARVEKARKDGALSASDQLRAGMQPVAGAGNQSHAQKVADAIAARDKAMYRSHERPAAK